MTAVNTDSLSSSTACPLADYFKFEPLLGPPDPFLSYSAWDADLNPEDYGDQSGRPRCDSWDDSGSDDDNDDDDCFSVVSFCENDDDNGEDEEEGWNIVHSHAHSPCTSAVKDNDDDKDTQAVVVPPSCSLPPPPNPLSRKDSKVRFCDEPPQVVCYEKCTVEEYSSLYYSVHELQTIIDEMKLEKQKHLLGNKGMGKGKKPQAQPSSAALNTGARSK